MYKDIYVINLRSHILSFKEHHYLLLLRCNNIHIYKTQINN